MVEAGLAGQGQIVVLTGPEGSGKTTQGKILADKLGFPKVTMGDVFRELREQNTDLGRKSKKLFEDHAYSNIDLYREAFIWRMQRDDVKKGFVFEGGFRFTDEVTNFDQLLKETNNVMPIKVIYLRIAGWQGAERLLKRGREDDTQEGILAILTNHYHDLGTRMLEARKKGPFFIVLADNNRTEEAISQEIMEKIDIK